jgi:hypothetical protein
MRSHLEYPGIETVVDLVRKPESLPTFTLRFQGPFERDQALAGSELLKARDSFLSWVDHPDNSYRRVLQVLIIFRHILRFEWDRPLYRYWYEEKPAFPFEECQRALNLLPLEPLSLVEAFRADFTEYLSGVRLFIQQQTHAVASAPDTAQIN